MSRARLFETIIDSGGRPVVGASVQVYEPNTTTPIAATLYADDIGGTTLANPLMTGADGSFLAYLDAPCRVDLFISAVGITSRTVPDVGVFPDPADFTTDTDLGNHVGAGNPHPAYALDSDLATHAADGNPHPAYALDTDLTTHAGAADPHTVYQKESERGAANGYAPLGAGSLVPIANLATGTPDGTKFVRDDGTLVLPAGATPTTTRGDLIKRGAAVDERLAIGTLGQSLRVTDIGGGVLESRWATKGTVQVLYTMAADVVTTTSLTAVDMTTLTLTPTILAGSLLMVDASARVYNSSAGAYMLLSLMVDGVDQGEIGTFLSDSANQFGTVAAPFVITGLAAGARIVKVRWLVSGGTGNATARRLRVIEVAL